jgi:hypothetical protein
MELVHKPTTIAADARTLDIQPQLCKALHHLNERARPVGAVYCDDGTVIIRLIVNSDLAQQAA